MLNSFVNSNNLHNLLGVSDGDNHHLRKRILFLFLFILNFFFFLALSILVSTSRTFFCRRTDRWLLHVVPDFKENNSDILSLSMVFASDDFIRSKIPTYP